MNLLKTYQYLICGPLTIITLALVILTEASGADIDERKLIYSKESLYNNIYVYRWQNYLSMTFGHNRKIYTESILNVNDELDLPVTYTKYLTVGAAYTRKLDNILMIGLGAGRTSWYLHRHLPASDITAVELDPEVISIAQRFFGLKGNERYELVENDGRRFLMRDESVYDLILIDAYRGPFVPFHLLTREFYAEVKAHLGPHGVMAQNVEPSTMLFDSAFATISSVFDHVDAYPADSNVVLVAYGSEPISEFQLDSRSRELQNQYGFRYPLPELIGEKRSFSPQPGAKVLTDDFAPVNALRSIEVHNRKWE
jgi:spermidine synthase